MRSESRATSTFYRRRGKRLLDLVFAVPALAVAMPVIALVSLGVAAALGRPVIFTRERPGLDGRTFRFHKFRTMTFERDSAGELKPDAERLTAFGRVLRTLSLDELPQLWNVVPIYTDGWRGYDGLVMEAISTIASTITTMNLGQRPSSY